MHGMLSARSLVARVFAATGAVHDVAEVLDGPIWKKKERGRR